ncbi:conserved hypothetical protein [Prochlorococcus marinus str. MIT 9515]|uniref:Helix-turn-helix domain of resolvase n=1 Tax=Prochlorococcus marinus (strain MIT 9515) TaxID=167542 RepID=A2BXR3_PROM5|nr:hypothetical protein [Prochlorococcus marinus]ABM72574.1 conserved hypothetical protein [Prochlorococcus marinus str. MIT 9515]
MAKRLSDKQKEQLTQEFINGKNINDIVDEFCSTKLTISRYLKKNLGEKTYQGLIDKSKISKGLLIGSEKSSIEKKNLLTKKVSKRDISHEEANKITSLDDESDFTFNEFVEVAPLNYEIDNITQKDLSSIPLSDIDFPKVVFMIVDNKIELQTKLLNDYPDWQFLSKEELKRTTIEIFYDLKIAKRSCSKEQKVIKVPNTDVFRIVAPLLISRGITRIVSSNTLISL